MQNKNFIVLLLCFICMYAFSQSDTFKPHVGVGFHGGMQIASVKFDPAIISSPSFSSINTISGGLIVNVMAHQNAGIQLELNISNRGWNQSIDSIYSYRRNLQFLEIPVLTHIVIGKKQLQFIINLGPYMAFQQDASESIDIYNNELFIVEDSTYTVMQPIDNAFDMGFTVDGGIGLNTSLGDFQIKARYSQSILNLFDKYPKGIYRYSQMSSLYFGVSYYYNFYLKADR